jgi:hypothetical protein
LAVSAYSTTDHGFTVQWTSRLIETGSVQVFTDSGCTSAVSPAPTIGPDQGNGYSHF